MCMVRGYPSSNNGVVLVNQLRTTRPIGWIFLIEMVNVLQFNVDMNIPVSIFYYLLRFEMASFIVTSATSKSTVLSF